MSAFAHASYRSLFPAFALAAAAFVLTACASETSAGTDDVPGLAVIMPSPPDPNAPDEPLAPLPRMHPAWSPDARTNTVRFTCAGNARYNYVHRYPGGQVWMDFGACSGKTITIEDHDVEPGKSYLYEVTSANKRETKSAPVRAFVTTALEPDTRI